MVFLPLPRVIWGSGSWVGTDAQLKDIVVGSKVNAIEAGKTVEIVTVKHHWDTAADVTYKDTNGNLNGQMVFAN